MDRKKMLVTYFKLSEKEMRERYLPVSTSDLLRKKIFAVGSAHIAVLEENGTVTAFGDDRHGQCNVKNWKDIIKVAAGDFHTVGLKKDGTVVAAGDNSFGQCNVEKLKGVTDVFASRSLTVGVMADNVLLVAKANPVAEESEEERRRREEAEKENRRRKEAEQLAAKLNNKIESAAAGLSAQIAAANGELLVQLQNMPPQKYKVPYNDPNRTMPIETAEETASREPETPSKLFTYSFVNGSVTISSYSGAADTVVIPRYIEGKPVTVISNRAFYNNTKLRRVVISDKLERIFPDAFKNCRNLEELVIPPNAGLSNIGDNAFEHCVSLKKVTFPESLERIGRWAFGQCIGLETVVIPNAISSIGFGAFSECPGLKNLYITENAQNRLSRLDLIVDNLNVVRIIQPNGL